jgi:hypothetical protein
VAQILEETVVVKGSVICVVDVAVVVVSGEVEIEVEDVGGVEDAEEVVCDVDVKAEVVV